MSVNWCLFNGIDIKAGWEAARKLASNEYTCRWYVGVTDAPLRRMEGQPQPHKWKYDCLHPLIVTREAADVERCWIKDLTQLLGRSRRGNNGDGGERVARGATKFVYLCIKWQRRRVVAATE